MQDRNVSFAANEQGPNMEEQPSQEQSMVLFLQIYKNVLLLKKAGTWQRGC